MRDRTMHLLAYVKTGPTAQLKITQAEIARLEIGRRGATKTAMRRRASPRVSSVLARCVGPEAAAAAAEIAGRLMRPQGRDRDRALLDGDLEPSHIGDDGGLPRFVRRLEIGRAKGATHAMLGDRWGAGGIARRMLSVRNVP